MNGEISIRKWSSVLWQQLKRNERAADSKKKKIKSDDFRMFWDTIVRY